MKEIKFRAWDVRHKEMVYLSGFDKYGEGWQGGDPEKRFYELYLIPKGFMKKAYDEIELMQFTGLCDKNGKEIYNGDIVKTYWPKKNKNSICEIEFYNAGFMGRKLFPVDDDYHKDDWFWPGCRFHLTQIRCTNYIEVIGNIYENPELKTKYTFDDGERKQI